MIPGRAAAFIAFILFNLAALVAIAAHAAFYDDTKSLAMQSDYVRRLGLTDLCIFTEARYTRHPSMADMHTAFQDHPASLEHFPSGSFIGPPPHIGSTYPSARSEDGRAQ